MAWADVDILGLTGDPTRERVAGRPTVANRAPNPLLTAHFATSQVSSRTLEAHHPPMRGALRSMNSAFVGQGSLQIGESRRGRAGQRVFIPPQ